MRSGRRHALTAGKVTAIYVVLGGAWILVSDVLVSGQWGGAQTLKGLGFVGITGLLLFLLLRFREAAERRLRGELERREVALLEAQRIGLLGSWVLELPSERLSWSPMVHTIFGLSPEEFAGDYEAFFRTVHPEDREAMREAQAEALAGRAPLDLRHRIVRPDDGSVRWVHERAQVIHDAEGRTLRLVGTVQDVTRIEETERRLKELNEELTQSLEVARAERERAQEAERALRESEASLQRAIRASRAALWDWDLRTDDVWFSDRFREILGYSREEFPDRLGSFFGVLHPEDEPRIRAAVRRHLEEGTRYEVEFRLRTKEGDYRWFQAWGEATREDGVPVRFSGNNRDITDQRELEQQLRRAQRLESVGLLAGGIAHDFNNMLSVILGYGDLALDRIDHPEEAGQAIEQVLAAADRSQELTQQLLAFGRQQILRPRRVDLTELVKGVHRLLERTVPESIHIRLALEFQGTLEIDAPGLEHAIVNLAVNARDAMADAGTLTISTRRERVRPDDARLPEDATAGDYAVVCVSDTGHGMDEATRNRIFDPFYTTKGEGEGTGLGLASVYGFVKQTGGWIDVTSEPGAGATFCLYLPAQAEEPAESAPAAATRESTAPSAEEAGAYTLLVAEDEELVRDLACDTLERAGFRVLRASDGEEALRRFEAGGVDLLISDMVMPKLQGLELARRARERAPDMPIVFTSGYSSVAAEDPLLSSGSVDFLAKPFLPKQLVEVVWRGLTAAREEA